MSQSFSNHQFSNLPDDLADIAAGILSRVQEFERRLGPAHDPSDPKTGPASTPSGVLFYVPTLHMDDAQYQGHGFLPHLVKKSFLDIDIGFVPVRQSVTVRHAKMSSHFEYEDVHVDLFNRTHHPDFVIGGYEINANRQPGIAIPLPPLKSDDVLVRLDEHWKLATEDAGYVTASFQRYFLVQQVRSRKREVPAVTALNQEMTMVDPEWAQTLKHSTAELDSYSRLLENPQYYEHLGMFTNYQGSLQFGVGLDDQEDPGEKPSPLQTYNKKVQGNTGDWLNAPILTLKELNR